jgi:hypothetical protein
MSVSSSGYKIKFIAGELAGRLFAIPESGSTIGRARTADIRPGGSDIGGEHLLLMPQGNDGVRLHVASDQKAWVNNQEVAGGSDKMLKPGDDVRIGNELTFVVEINDNPLHIANTVATENDNDEATAELSADEATAVDDATVVQKKDESSDEQTRYASEAELKDLRQIARSEKHRRRVLLAVSILLFCGFLAGVWYHYRALDENPVTWPGEVSGKYDDGEFRTVIEPDGKCLVYYPNTPYTVTKEDGCNFEVMTALGKNMDVPFHIVFTVNTIENGYRVTRKASLEAWQQRASESEQFAFLDNPRPDIYRPVESGYPYHVVSYVRQDNGLRWQGYASYMRYFDKEMILLREVPTTQFWRANRVLRRFGSFVVSPTLVDNYFEIPEKCMDGSSTRLLQRVSYELRKDISSAVWDDLDLMLRTLLVRAYENKDQVLIEAVRSYWYDYTESTQVWYSKECLAYQNCEANHDTEGMNRIIDECLRKFPDADDYRHIKILKNIWTVEED